MKNLKGFTSKLLKAAFKPRKGEEGWTFLETIIVIGIILILMSTVGFVTFRFVDQARQAAAKNDIEVFGIALEAYMLDCGEYPTKEQGLSALREKPILSPVPEHWAGPYIKKSVPNDPWGTAYEYTVPGPNGLPFGIRSFGADHGEGGDGKNKDLMSWENS